MDHRRILGTEPSSLTLSHRTIIMPVILQTFPPLQTFPSEDLQWYWKTIADLPPLQIFPGYRFNRYRFYLYKFILNVVILWGKKLVIYITEYNSLSINVKYCMYNLLLWFNTFFSIYPKMRIRNFTKKVGRSAMLQIFPRGRSAMNGGRSAMLQTFALRGRSAMLQIFQGEVLQCCRPSGGEGLQGGRSAIQECQCWRYF